MLANICDQVPEQGVCLGLREAVAISQSQCQMAESDRFRRGAFLRGNSGSAWFDLSHGLPSANDSVESN
jgi:hypothetical protein